MPGDLVATLNTPEGSRFSELERLRRPTTWTTGTAFSRALDRMAATAGSLEDPLGRGEEVRLAYPGFAQFGCHDAQCGPGHVGEHPALAVHPHTGDRDVDGSLVGAVEVVVGSVVVGVLL
ncbi:hypothetical protein GCM10010306_104870 [Streptomyces umbrinus]|nr:hypothetical protein GCM10010306_104870 [Streptomyces umbrinus]